MYSTGDYHVNIIARNRRQFHSCWECTGCGLLNAFVINWNRTKLIRKTDDGYPYYTKEVRCNSCGKTHLLDFRLDGKIHATDVEKLETNLPVCLSSTNYIQRTIKLPETKDQYARSSSISVYSALVRTYTLEKMSKVCFICSNYIEVAYLLDTIGKLLKEHKISNNVCSYYPPYCRLESITNNSNLYFTYYTEDSDIKCEVKMIGYADIDASTYLTIKDLKEFPTLIKSTIVEILTISSLTKSVEEFK